MKRISFIHAADLHLDSPMVGLKHLPKEIFERMKESTFTALKKITKAAIDREVDFVILAGDLFDGEDRSLRAQSRFRREMLKLNEKNIPVYVIYGNHDHLNGSWVHLDMPENVHVFSSKVETKYLKTRSGVAVHLYGFSYPTRHVFERKIEEYQKKTGADFDIGILHGNESSGTEHENYAPFSVKDLKDKSFDYWALGHIHKRSVLSEEPPILYPGNIQGRNKKEIGEKGFYHVRLSEVDEAQLEFIEASDIVWEEAVVDAEQARTFDDLLQLCRTTIHHVRKEQIGTLLTLNIRNLQIEGYPEHDDLEGSLQEILLDEESGEQSFVWIVGLGISLNQSFDKAQLIQSANFFGELFQTIENYSEMKHALAPLYGHSLGRKYLEAIPEEEQKELLERAEQLLITLLGRT